MKALIGAAERAEAELHGLYWEACDGVQEAIDPEALGLPQWAQDMLAEAFEIALYCQHHPEGWAEGRART